MGHIDQRHSKEADGQILTTNHTKTMEPLTVSSLTTMISLPVLSLDNPDNILLMLNHFGKKLLQVKTFQNLDTMVLDHDSSKTLELPKGASISCQPALQKLVTSVPTLMLTWI